MIFRTNKITNYTKIDNRYLEDKNISLKAKGLLTLMLSLPDNWKFNVNGLCLVNLLYFHKLRPYLCIKNYINQKYTIFMHIH